MSAKVEVAKGSNATSQGFVYSALILGWLLPGAGHFLVKRWVRGAILFVSITSIFVLGLAMQGKLYSGVTDVLDILGLAGDLGNGLLFFVAKQLGLGSAPVQVTTADYGTKFIVVAGLLNIISAVDAHNLRIGRKQ